MPDLGALRAAAGWLNRQRGPAELVRAVRELLPGDPHFGDPISTAGAEPAQVLARRAWAASGGHWTLLAEIGLATLQLADWLGPSARGTAADRSLAVLFTDLVGYSSWAMRAGDEDSLEALRRVDAAVTAAVEQHGGAVVKRLGDGTMAVFAAADDGLTAAQESLRDVREIQVDGYSPLLRAGLHVGSPQPIGGDFIGIDVNIAARLCEAAEPDEILMTDRTVAALDEVPEVEERPPRTLIGVPAHIGLYGTSADAA